MPDENLRGKTVFITGASSGIGLALARRFFELGANVVATARREDKLRALAKELTSYPGGPKLLAVRCDVTVDGDLEKAVAQSLSAFGRLDIVIANAGFGVAGNVEKVSLDDFRRQFETNIFGVLRTVKATVPELKKTRGTIALVGSVAGYVAFPGGAPYAMSKHAVHALARSLRFELAQDGVAVVLVAPGFVDSEIRLVDNEGKLHPQAKESAPQWLVMPTDKAARQIASGILRRCPELDITLHGKIIIFIQRHFPWLISLALQRGLRARGEPQ